jgi:predicted membrane protein
MQTMMSAESRREEAPIPRMAWMPLCIAIGITLVLTVYPMVLAVQGGQADHLAATLALWAMSAGFVRGVGFIPQHRVLQWVFSTPACLLTLGMAVYLIAKHGM